MATCILGQSYEGQLPSCSVSMKETGSKDDSKLNNLCVCSTHGNLLSEKSIYA